MFLFLENERFCRSTHTLSMLPSAPDPNDFFSLVWIGTTSRSVLVDSAKCLCSSKFSF